MPPNDNVLMGGYQSLSRFDQEQGVSSHAPAVARPQKQRATVLVAPLLTIAIVVLLGMPFLYHQISQRATPLPEALSGKKKLACESPDYTEHTLKRAVDIPVAALLGATWDNNRFEASGVIKVGSAFYAVDDDSFALGFFTFPLSMLPGKNALLWPNEMSRQDDTIKDKDRTTTTMAPMDEDGSEEEHAEGGYEGLSWDQNTGRFYLIMEAIPDEGSNTSFHGLIVEAILSPDAATYHKKAACPVEYSFDNGNKGFEGVAHFVQGGEHYILGLCEGNHCKGGSKGKEVGNGKLVLARRRLTKRPSAHPEDILTDCIWSFMYEIPIPPEADFIDYSDLALSDEGRVLIVSQESSKLWVGHLDTTDINKLHLHKGNVYNFPRDDECRILYCNVEGIDWVTEHLVVAASDMIKSKGKQDYRCMDKDQSIHLFVIP
eukprot:gb/GEZN01006052.1/.p1 GENE.gb/GEZN01006052.1/~~gb/GEZN01006052.1/.p1  ORF type:complete len:432 (-),score=54.96 gb/GEZN01006052.1/:372-1667(-)